MNPRRAGALAALFLLLATIAFGIGIGIEKVEEGEHGEPTAVEQPQDAANEPAAEEAHAEEELFGIDLEATPLVITGAALALLLMLALWRLSTPPVLAIAVLFCLGWAVLDGIEASRKLSEEATIGVLALVALGFHAGAATAAAVGVRGQRTQPTV